MRTAPLLLLCVLSAAHGAPEPIPVAIPVRQQPVSYVKDVADVLDAKCVGCHNGARAESKFALEDVPGMLKGGKRGPALVPGKAEESPLFQLAAHRADPAMPPEGKKHVEPLTPAELGLLKLWIDAGAKDDSAESAGPPAPIELGPLPAGLRPIVAVDLTADGKLVAAGRGNLVEVHEVDSGRVVVALAGHKDIVQSIRLSPDGGRLAAGSHQSVTLWDLPAGKELRSFGPHAARVLAIDLSPDGKLLATGGGEPSRSGEVKLWEIASGRLVRSWDTLHSDTVFAVRFSPDGSRLATGAADKFVKVVAIADGQELRAFEGHTHHVLGVDWRADGKQLISGGADSVLKLWDVEAGESIRTSPLAGKQVTAVRWPPGRPQALGASGDGLVRAWNTETGNVERTFGGPADYLYSVAASRDGLRVAAGGAEGVLFVWKGDDGQVLRKIGPAAEPAHP